MLQCIAVDDEPLALQLLEDYISKVSFLKLGALCNDAFETQKYLQQNEVDLIFIDIQMPGLTGLQFIQTLTSRPMIILVTAYEKFAIDGFNLNVIDYVLKPVEFTRFLQACNKAEELHQLKKLRNASPNNADYFFVNTDYSLFKIMFDDIIWIEGLRDYVKFHLKSTSRPLVVRASLKSIEDEELPKSKFIRIHRSYILSIQNISSIRKNSVFVGEMELPVGDTYKEVINQLTGKNTS